MAEIIDDETRYLATLLAVGKEPPSYPETVRVHAKWREDTCRMLLLKYQSYWWHPSHPSYEDLPASYISQARKIYNDVGTDEYRSFVAWRMKNRLALRKKNGS